MAPKQGSRALVGKSARKPTDRSAGKQAGRVSGKAAPKAGSRPGKRAGAEPAGLEPTGLPVPFYRLHDLLQTIRRIGSLEDHLCMLLTEIRGSQTISTTLHEELQGMLEQIPAAEFSREVERLEASLGTPQGKEEASEKPAAGKAVAKKAGRGTDQPGRTAKVVKASGHSGAGHTPAGRTAAGRTQRDRPQRDRPGKSGE